MNKIPKSLDFIDDDGTEYICTGSELHSDHSRFFFQSKDGRGAARAYRGSILLHDVRASSRFWARLSLLDAIHAQKQAPIIPAA